MTMSDPLGDMLTRIRNGQRANKTTIVAPYARLHEAVCAVLKDEGYIREFAVEDLDNNKKQIRVGLKYDHGRPVIQTLKRLSRPGRRWYTKSREIPRMNNGLGITVVSTPQGVMADHNARRNNIGGEVLCQVF